MVKCKLKKIKKRREFKINPLLKFYFLRYVITSAHNASNIIAIGLPVALASAISDETCLVVLFSSVLLLSGSVLLLSCLTLMENVAELAL